MKIHFLSGDSLVEPFKKTNIEGEIFVCRECLVDGDIQASNLDEFWEKRESYLTKNYDSENTSYKDEVKSQFLALTQNSENSEINLWFEYELFCQVNLWFCLSLLSESESEVFIVYPKFDDRKDIWKGFGYLDEHQLAESFSERKKLNDDDIALGKNLWKAFQNKDYKMLTDLSKNNTEAFPTLKEVGEAAVKIDQKPRQVIEDYIALEGSDFGKVFRKFNREQAIYGFGDLQVKRIYDSIQERIS